ncbi:hypothetical protein Nmel_005821 [Mimus melanotis]
MDRTSFKNNRLTFTDPEDHMTRINVWTNRFVTTEEFLVDEAMEYDSANMYGVSRSISNKERESSRGYAPIQKDTGFDKRKFEK